MKQDNCVTPSLLKQILEQTIKSLADIPNFRKEHIEQLRSMIDEDGTLSTNRIIAVLSQEVEKSTDENP